MPEGRITTISTSAAKARCFQNRFPFNHSWSANGRLRHNLKALAEIVRFIYDNIQYAEFNTKSDYCHECGYDGEIVINKDGEWECPACGNKDHAKMNVTRRTCGYLGENFWNVGKTKEIAARVLHI